MVVLDSPMAIEITKIYSELMSEFDRKDTTRVAWLWCP